MVCCTHFPPRLSPTRILHCWPLLPLTKNRFAMGWTAIERASNVDGRMSRRDSLSVSNVPCHGMIARCIAEKNEHIRPSRPDERNPKQCFPMAGSPRMKYRRRIDSNLT